MRYTSLAIRRSLPYGDPATRYYKITRRRLVDIGGQAEARAAQRRGGVIYASFPGMPDIWRCDDAIPTLEPLVFETQPEVAPLAEWETELLGSFDGGVPR